MFSYQIRYLRQSKGLSQVQLADKLDVSKQSVSNWENDNIMPSIDMLVKIADFFNVSTDYILGRKTKNSKKNFIDVTGLTPEQIEHIRYIVDDIRKR